MDLLVKERYGFCRRMCRCLENLEKMIDYNSEIDATYRFMTFKQGDNHHKLHLNISVRQDCQHNSACEIHYQVVLGDHSSTNWVFSVTLRLEQGASNLFPVHIKLEDIANKGQMV